MTTLVSFNPFDILPDDSSPAPVVQVIPAVKPLPRSLQQAGCNGNNLPSIKGELQQELTKRREGRMSLFTLENAALVIEGIENGKTMQAIADEIGVSRNAIWSWMQLSQDFYDEVARAREYQGHAAADNAVNILDDVVVDETVDPKTAMAQLRKAEQRARIRMDLAKAFNFKQYGDKKQNLNVNLNAEVRPIDLTKYA